MSKRDENRIVVLMAETNDANRTPTALLVDPTTRRLLVDTNPATGGATTELDNLETVAINTSLISDTDSTDDLGSSTKYWKNLYADKIFLDADSTIINTDIDAWNAHLVDDGADHSFIDQSVVSGASPTFDGDAFTGIDADDVDIADAGTLITATDVEDALQENRTAIDLNTTHRGSDGTDHADVGTNTTAIGLNTTHRGSDGSDHDFIDQDVTIGSGPAFTDVVLTTPALGTPSAGVLTSCTGTASGLTSGNVTTNANLTGPITSVGNATSIALQTGTGTTFVMNTSPTLVKPTINASILALTTDTDGATITFNMAASNIHTVTLEGNRTLAVLNVSVGQAFVVRLTQDGSGSRTVTWFGTIKWVNSTAPTLTTTAAKTDVFGFLCTSAGNYDGYIVAKNL